METVERVYSTATAKRLACVYFVICSCAFWNVTTMWRFYLRLDWEKRETGARQQSVDCGDNMVKCWHACSPPPPPDPPPKMIILDSDTEVVLERGRKKVDLCSQGETADYNIATYKANSTVACLHTFVIFSQISTNKTCNDAAILFKRQRENAALH